MKRRISFDIWILILILIFSFFLETYKLSKNPIGFFCDEASVGYDAYLILTTGKDRHNEYFPLFFKGFNFDNVSPYQVYFTVPFVGLFGLTESAVRLAPVFFSLIELFFFYLLMKEFIPRYFALAGTFVLSISPWHFHLSRINFGDFYSWTLLTIISYYFFVQAYKTKRVIYFAITAIFFGLTTYSYTPSRMITPILFGLILCILLMKKYFKIIFMMTFIYLILSIPFISFHINDPHSFQRIKDTMGIDIKSHSKLKNSTLDLPKHLFTKYVLHYSDLFLFEKGDTNFPNQFLRRHSISELGLLYAYQKWLVIVGIGWLLYTVIKFKRLDLIFTLFLLFIFPIADSLTIDKAPYATRSYLGVVPFHILIALGIYGIYQILTLLSIKQKILDIIFIYLFLFITFNSTLILIERFEVNPLTTSDFWGWQYGPRDIMRYFLLEKNNYDDLYMSGEFNGGEIFPKFYDPENTCQDKCKIGDFYREPGIYNPERKQIFSLSPDYLNKSDFRDKFKIKQTIFYPNKTVAFYIGEVQP